jgi:nucleotide-binding universal stress UspA family protein
MTNAVPKRPLFSLRRIFYPTDLSKESEVAFAHALKLALAYRAELRIMHIEHRPGAASWDKFPHVRDTLTEWGLLPPGSDRQAVAGLGLRIDKVVATGSNPARAILEFLDGRPADLLVLSTHHGGTGIVGWHRGGIAEPLARHARMLTLFIPSLIDGFVSRQDGGVQLRRVLIPMDRDPDPRSAIEAVANVGRALGCQTMATTLLYVGAEADIPKVATPVQDGWTWTSMAREGDAVEQILKVAAEQPADLIAMTTQGHQGFLDALRGSTTERVLRAARCPVLAVPVPRVSVEAPVLTVGPANPQVMPA